MEIERHKKGFGNHAEDYTKYRRPYMKELYELFFSVFPADGKRILDVACGTGKSTESLVKPGLEVFGCDHDSRMIEEAKKQAGLKGLAIEYKVAGVEALPFEDGYFDAVTVGTAFHWFVNDEAMREIKRVLKPSGLLFVYWTLTTKDIPEADEIPSRIFRSYNWDKVPSELRDLEHISKFFMGQGMEGVETKRLPFTYDTTVEERVGLQKTASSYDVLSEGDKGKFLKEVEDVLREKLGSRKHFTLEEEIQVCFGFKN